MTSDGRWLVHGTSEDPLVVLRSRFWGFNAIAVFDGDEAAVVDPGIYPDEIESLREATTTRALSTGTRRVTHVALTHSHHDHIRGWMRFPDAAIVFPAVAASKTEDVQGRILRAKNKIDGRLGVDDPEFRYPRADVTFDEQASFRVGELEIEMRFVPGHSNCTSVVWIPALRTLCTADYLVSPGLPYCRWQAHEFEEAIATMRGWVVDEGIERIVPAHNDMILGREAILAALDTESRYFRDMREDVRAGRDEGLSREVAVRQAASRASERRGVDLGARARQDIDNAQRVLAEEWAE